jgi:hypothetical protein
VAAAWEEWNDIRGERCRDGGSLAEERMEAGTSAWAANDGVLMVVEGQGAAEDDTGVRLEGADVGEADTSEVSDTGEADGVGAEVRIDATAATG